MPSCGPDSRTIQLGENHVCTIVTKPFEICDAGTKDAGTAREGTEVAETGLLLNVSDDADDRPGHAAALHLTSDRILVGRVTRARTPD